MKAFLLSLLTLAIFIGLIICGSFFLGSSALAGAGILLMIVGTFGAMVMIVVIAFAQIFHEWR